MHARSAPDRRLYFVRKLASALEGIFADPSLDLLQRRGVWFLRAFLLEDASILDDWDAANDLPDHRLSLPGVLATEEIFPRLSDHARDIVVNVLESRAPASPSAMRLLYDLRVAAVLAQRQEEQLARLIENSPISRVASSGIPVDAWWDRIVERLFVKNWDTQNEAVQILRRVGRGEIGRLQDDEQEKLGRNVMQAADGNAFGAINLIGEIGLSEDPWPAPFVRGVVLEVFANEDGSLRFKTSELGRSLRTLRAVRDTERQAILNEVVQALRDGAPKYSFVFEQERERALTVVRSMSDNREIEGLDEVVTSIEAIENPEHD